MGYLGKNIYVGILILGCCSAVQSVAHDLRVARFRITATSSGYDLTINFDREDIFKEIYNTQKYQKEIIDQLFNYVKQHFSISIDGEDITFELTKMEFTNDNIILKGKLLSVLRAIKKIDVYNTCLVNTIDRHLNIMEFFLNDRERYFRLDKDRTRTTVTY